VIGGTAERFGEKGELLENTFEAVPGLPTGFNQTLHLLLTTPEELEQALDNGWASALVVADAVRRGDYKVLHADSIGKRLLRRLAPPAATRKRAVRE
jgi:hypothetical protein